MSRPDKPVSSRVLGAVTGYLTALSTRGAPPRVPPHTSARQLAIECATALDLGVRTVQRAFRDENVANLVAQLVAHSPIGGTTPVPPAANPQVTALPPHPDDDTRTSLLLGDLCHLSSPRPADAPSPDPTQHRYYKRLRPNAHPGYCVVRGCGEFVDTLEGSVLIPYPSGSSVRLLCAEHALGVAVDLVLARSSIASELPTLTERPNP